MMELKSDYFHDHGPLELTVSEDELLLQELYHKDPWRFLASCVMLNQTSRKQVDKIRYEFFELCPDPGATVAMMEPDLVLYDERVMGLLQHLGLQRVRYRRLYKLACELVHMVPTSADEVMLFTGCGEYARDSWAIFVDKDYSVKPGDKELHAWLDKNVWSVPS